ncbi:hypothetical protein BKP35_13670 [Anaerobacillus arseniciselenatis]|uniref:Uncharacterized protein n=1 Tax=Anaerobacillus arseniciselenatis TaxID=85682 RepID=A0A1S2LCD1_9BACI|nr:hypothetical protein [Anaerobacillus arseniciselenatis]OIJ10158.1 hypothetical protein BKP35_13670 [Anaerobacillus arseniciselenatis]
MLEVTFTYEGEQPIFETLRLLNFKYIDGIYVLKNKELQYTITAENNATAKKLVVEFSKELSFEQYKHIHKIIKAISENIVADLDDHLALMGYLEDGSEAYIYHGWNQWLKFLEAAKHVSMEGQKVQVYDNQLLIAEGILVDAVKNEASNDDFKVIQCTLISKDGEKSVMGEDLKIIPTGEF